MTTPEGASATPPRKKRIIVDMVADPVCPWCYVGLQSFTAAKALLSTSFDIVDRFRPYQLNPNTPDDGADRKAHYALKFPDAGARDAMRQNLMVAAKEAGGDFDPFTPTRLVNTLRAHAALRAAHFEARHLPYAHALYNAYWKDDADISAPETLIGLATLAGLAEATIAQALSDGDALKAVRQEADQMRQIGVTAAPTFIINERSGFSGALAPNMLAKSITGAAVAT